MNEIQNSKRFYDLEEEKPYLFRSRAAQALAPRVGYWNLRPAPARTPGRLALPVRHRLRLRRMPGGLGWRTSLQWQAGLFVIWCLELGIYRFGILRFFFRHRLYEPSWSVRFSAR